MILPGNLFVKKIDKNFWWKPAFILVAVNLVVHLMISVFEAPDYSLDSDIQNLKKVSNLKLMQSMHLQAQDRILKQHVTDRTKKDPYLFIKDVSFWNKAQNMKFVGDQVKVEKNKLMLQHIQEAFENSTQQIYGLSSYATSPLNWITYQFTHAHIFHLFSNIIFLLLVVSILQQTVSSYWIVGVYVISGLASGLSYILFCDDISLPLIGASGSVSGLIAFLGTVKGAQNIPWSYFISPWQGGFGKIYLPAYLVFPIYLITDFTSVLISTYGVAGSVAHSAHVGGALCGFAFGLGFHFYQSITLKISTI